MDIPKKEDRGINKVSKIPIKVIPAPSPSKPKWLKVKAPVGNQVDALKKILRSSNLNTVCEQAACPNLGDCFTRGTATFMILGNFCTRRCPFCDVAHGRPFPVDNDEPERLAKLAAQMALKYLVITSVDRDDLKDGGAGHFADCIRNTRLYVPEIKIEILVPDFRGRMDKALDSLSFDLPDVFNHNMETVRSLYRQIRPGADYEWSLKLIKTFKKMAPQVPTKSGIMVGFTETKEEIKQTLQDLMAADCDMVTIGQYLQPSSHHLPVTKFVHPDEFREYEEFALSLGFKNVTSGPLVRSSYHADEQSIIL